MAALVLALGAGWAVYEQRHDPTPVGDATRSDTEDPQRSDASPGSVAEPAEERAAVADRPESSGSLAPAVGPDSSLTGPATSSEAPPASAEGGGDEAPREMAERAQDSIGEPQPKTSDAATVGSGPVADSEPVPESGAAEALADAGSAGSRLMATINRALADIFGGEAELPADPQRVDRGSVAEAPPRPAVAADRSTTPPPPEGSAVAQRATDGARARSAGDADDAGVAAVEPAAPPPSFDIVRVERDGRAVIAGRAPPGAVVELKTGNRVIDRVLANREGQWVAVPARALTPADRELSLAAQVEDQPAIESEEVVVVAVPEPPQATPDVDAEPPPPQPAEVAEATPATEPLAVLLPRDGSRGGRILQAPGRISSDGQLALIMLDYDDAGEIELSGEAPPGAPVRIYVDNQPAGEFVVPESGRWTVPLARPLEPGDYTLRLDQLDAAGKPVARLETPFTRAGEQPRAGEAEVDLVIVQPGNSLWRIARRLLGSGFEYVHIYEANQSQIRDPDLIYPGQVFEIPADLGTAGESAS